MRTLDEIATDFIIETCHEAEAHARHAGRAKIKVDDFQFALRNDGKKLGRVQELLEMEKRIKRDRQAFNTDEGKVTREARNGDEDGAKGPGRGKRRKGNGVKTEGEADSQGQGADAVKEEEEPGIKREASFED